MLAPGNYDPNLNGYAMGVAPMMYVDPYGNPVQVQMMPDGMMPPNMMYPPGVGFDPNYGGGYQSGYGYQHQGGGGYFAPNDHRGGRGGRGGRGYQQSGRGAGGRGYQGYDKNTGNAIASDAYATEVSVSDDSINTK